MWNVPHCVPVCIYTVTIFIPIAISPFIYNVDGLYHFYVVTFCVWDSLFIEICMYIVYIKNTVMVGPDKPAIPGQRLFLVC